MDVTVSVIIPHFGDPRPTARLVRSVSAQLSTRDEIIVVDDHSPIPFPEQPGCRTVRRAINGGFGSACNAGAALATCELLLFLNSDLEIPASFVRSLVDAAAPWQPCVAGPRVIEHGRVAPSARRFPSVAQQLIEWLTPLTRWRSSLPLRRAVGHDVDVNAAVQPSVTDWLVGACILVPREQFLGVGGFDTRFFMNAEEVDLQRRLRAAGVPSVFIPAVSAHHASGGSSDPALRRGWLVDSRLAYANKWGRSSELRLSLTLASGANFVWNCGRGLLGRSVRPLATLQDELRLIWKGAR